MKQPSIKLQAQLDKAKSARNINSDVKDIQDRLNPVNLQAKMDSKQEKLVVSQAQHIGEKAGEAVTGSLQKAMDNAAPKDSDFFSNLNKSLSQQAQEVRKSTGSLFTLNTAFQAIVSQTKEALSELKALDTALVQLGHATGFSQNELKDLGRTALESAGRYGKTAESYLSLVQEMYQAGLHQPHQMAELSMLTQASGSIDKETANRYLLTSNAAFDLKENTEELLRVLDGQNHIASHTAVSMADMAQATSEAAFTASQCGVTLNELSSLIAAAASQTHKSGSETGNALKALFSNLQDTANGPVKDALNSVGISMTQMVSGTELLKTPVQLLNELSLAFASLQDGDFRQETLLSAIAGENSDTLLALLKNWSSFDDLLDLYNHGTGAAAKEAENFSQSWENSLQRLSNTWTSTINNLVDSEAASVGINSLNGILLFIEKLTKSLSLLETVGIGAGLLSGIKNTGKHRMSVRISKPVFCFEYALST